MSDCGIIIVNYNQSKLFELQVELIQRYLPPCKMTLASTSTQAGEVERLRELCAIHRINYIECPYPGIDPSDQHGRACNQAFQLEARKHARVLFLDHDCFPFAPTDPFSVISKYTFYGRKWTTANTQQTYIWPGFFGVNRTRYHASIDFMPVNGLGDTGVKLSNEIARSREDREVYFVEEKHIPFDFHEGRDIPHLPNYYEEYDGKWMHFVKSSNYMKDDPEIHKTRVNKLLKILEERQ